MNCQFIAITLLALTTFAHGKGLSSTLTLIEQSRIAGQLQRPHDNLADIYYAASGLNALGKSLQEPEKACALAADQVDSSSAKSLFQYSEVTKIIKCQAPDLKPALAAIISGETTTIALSQSIAAMINLGYNVDTDLTKKFVAAVKDNDSPMSAAISFYVASLLPKSPELKAVIDMVEDIMAQADEIDSTMLQFEGGLTVTSGVVRGIFALAEQQGKALLKKEQVMKLASFFLNRKYVFELKDIHSMLVAVSALANNKFQVPVVVTTFKSSAITKDAPSLKVRVTNLLDKAVPDVKVTAKSFSDANGKVFFEEKSFSKCPEGDNIIIETDVGIATTKGYFAAHTYELDVASTKAPRGIYKVAIGVDYKEGSQQYLSGGVFEITCRVLVKVALNDVKIGVGDNGKGSATSHKSLSYPNQLDKALVADHHQKVVMTFSLVEMDSGAEISAHQVFVRLTNEISGQEIFFVAEAQSEGNYKFNLDVGSTGKESFNNLSGKYKMSLIIGDATIQVPVNWPIGVLSLTFSGEPKATKRSLVLSGPMPVIEHQFRVPEKRPSKLVSTVFTGLVFVPLLVMLAVWTKIGANLANFQLSLSTLFFHFGLAGVFGLYYMFWVKLDMFLTLKLLMLVGGVTFLGGNSMLAKMAADKYRH
jgi:oligosaccharyltransferase complex subunit delta (ribophorin II)